ncbi:hypothetical protein E5288_WYG008952 [Bos mutus]|uniref:Uncharacterized protein n=1 Tax=Bos mutus TaxID=72004 RepID=A0A6B0QWM0_9CETA|nr:hypothetical protein [Bos mutus]
MVADRRGTLLRSESKVISGSGAATSSSVSAKGPRKGLTARFAMSAEGETERTWLPHTSEGDDRDPAPGSAARSLRQRVQN